MSLALVLSELIKTGDHVVPGQLHQSLVYVSSERVGVCT